MKHAGRGGDSAGMIYSANSLRRFVLCPLAGAALLTAGSAQAANRVWTGANPNADWLVAQNWQNGLIPGAADVALFGVAPRKAVQAGPEVGAVVISESGYFLGAAQGVQLVLRQPQATVLTASYALGSSQIPMPVVLNQPGQSIAVTNFGATLTLGRGLVWGANPVAIQNAGRLEISGLSAVSGSTQGRLRLTGTGLTLLNGTNTAGASVEVLGGELRVAGTLASSSAQGALTLAEDAVLSGTGTVSSRVTTLGNVAPGNGEGSVGTLNLAYFDFDAETALRGLYVDLRSTGHDQLALGRAPSLHGAGLSVVMQAGWQPVPGTAYEIVSIEGNGRANGEFAGRAEGSVFTVDGQRWRISYSGGSGNDITLTALATAPTGRRLTWTGASSDLWSLGANWQGGAAPLAGDTVVFGSAAVLRASRCDMPAGFVCGGMEFGAGEWTVSGNTALTLTGPVNLVDATADVEFGPGVALGDDAEIEATDGAQAAFTGAVDLHSFTATVDTRAGAQVTFYNAIHGIGGVTKSGDGTLSYSRRANPGSVANTYTGRTLVKSGALELTRQNAQLIRGELKIDASGASAAAPVCVQSVDDVLAATTPLRLGFRGTYRLTALQTLQGIGIIGQNKEPVGTRYAVDAREGLLQLTSELGLGVSENTSIDGEIITLQSRIIGGIRMAPVLSDAEIVLALGGRLFCEADMGMTPPGEPLRVTGGELFTIEAPQSAARIEVNIPGLRFHANDPDLHLVPGAATLTRMDGTVGQITGGVIAPALASEVDDADGRSIAVLNVAAGLTNPARLDLTQESAGNTISTDVIHVQGSVIFTQPVDLTLSPLVGDSTPLVGQTITILTNDGNDPVNGTFRDLPQGSLITAGTYTYAISYTGGDGNDITLTVQSPTLSYTTYRWNGAGADDDWSTGANWVGGIAPVSTGNLIFEPGSAISHQNLNISTGTVDITGTHAAPFQITRTGGRLLTVASQFKCSAQGAHGVTMQVRATMNSGSEIAHTGTAPLTFADSIAVGSEVTLRITGDCPTPTLITNPNGVTPGIVGSLGNGVIKTGAGAVRVEGMDRDLSMEVKAGTFMLYPGASNTLLRGPVTVGGGTQSALFESNGALARSALTVLANGNATLTGAQELSSLTLNGGALTAADAVTLVNGSLIIRGTDAALHAPLLVRREAGTQENPEVRVLTGLTLTHEHAAALGFSAGTGRVLKTGRGKWIIRGAALPNTTGFSLLDITAGEVSLRRLEGADTGSVDITIGSETSEGRLTGDGTAKTLTLNSGSFAPGIGNTGTFTVNRATFTGGTFEVELARTNGSDLLNVVTGGNVGNRVSISGNAQLAISLPRQAPQEGVATIILSVAGGIPIEGSFANAPEGGILTAGTTRFAVTYTGGDGNDLALTRLPDAAVTPFLTPGPVNITFTGPESAPRSTLDLSATATTQPGGTVRLQRSTGLQNWTTIKTVTADETGSAAFSLTDVNGGPRVFFRYLLP